ncbi:hypothetical protein SB48_HM08orf00942 [Heyndrickxia coagulans]|uniref:Uncharacterized protein n=1 Tax=Heyndrickxia coagulans TaxID=1398 RepID=A0AAN0WAQ7_HEYCO|nr:hypothetical protein SB48_HM08orf00942 [Heyndrickxia coagulans]
MAILKLSFLFLEFEINENKHLPRSGFHYTLHIFYRSYAQEKSYHMC